MTSNNAACLGYCIFQPFGMPLNQVRKIMICDFVFSFLSLISDSLQIWANDIAPLILLTHVKSWLIGKDSDAGRDWGQEEKGTTENEMAGWHHWLDGHEFEWIPGVGDGQGGLACCDSRGRKESDTTERLIWSESCWVGKSMITNHHIQVVLQLRFWIPV